MVTSYIVILNRPHRLFAVFSVVAFALLLIIATYRAPHRKIPDALFVGDGFGYYIYLPSIVIDRDIDLRNQLARQPEQVNHWTFSIVDKTGKPGNVFQIGPAILWLPFFLLAHLAHVFLDFLGIKVRCDGFGWGYELPVYCGSFLYGIIGIWYMWRLLARYSEEWLALFTTLVIVLASPIAAYLWFKPDMSHILSMALVAMLFYYLDIVIAKKMVDWRVWAGLGAITGLIAAIRAPGLIVVFPLFYAGTKVIAGHSCVRQKVEISKVFSAATSYSVCAALVFSPQLFVWKALYGNVFTIPPNPFYTRMTWHNPDIINYLFSTYHGLFPWSPILIFATVGIIIGWIEGRPILRCCLILVLCAIYFNSSIHLWWVGESFGERRMVDYGVIFSCGFGYIMERCSLLRQKSSWLGFGGLIVFNWLLMFRYFTHDLPEYGYVSWGDLYLNTIMFPFRLIWKFLG